MFNKRSHGLGITYVSSYEPGTKFKNSVENGDEVTLKIDNESILVRNVQIKGNGKYSGTVYGFEPSIELTYKDLSLDDEVEFEEINIISCSGR